ncbi:MAG: hypothetical protein U1G07_04395 [Verrucomicrobiota bacterium]
MKRWLAPFNIYLLTVLIAWSLGCQTSDERKKGKEASTLRLFLEAHRDGNDSQSGVPIYRANPIRVNVEREPFLSETDLESASVVDLPGGFAIRAQFDGHGALILEGVTVAHKGAHIAVQSNFGESRWLAAPLITRRISNGEFVFTPDATRDEADRVVRGLTNLITKVKKRSAFK